MMQKIQKFGSAMLVPVSLFMFAGLVVALGSVFTNPIFFPQLAQEDTSWYSFWFIIQEGGWTVFNQIPIVFAAGLPIGLAKKARGRAAIVSLVTYLTYNYFIGALLSQWGPFFGINNYDAELVENSTNEGLTYIAGIKTFDTNILGALIIGGIIVWLHNRYFDKKLPEWLGQFQGQAFVAILGFFSALILAVVTCFVWPQIQAGIVNLQGFLTSTGIFGVGLTSFLMRFILPTGLHHFVYIPMYFGPALVPGGLQAFWLENLNTFAASTESLKDLAPEMGFMIFGNENVFALPAICLAFYATADKSRKKETAALLIPAGLTAFLLGITEPVEFTFLFAAPFLWVVYPVIGAIMHAIMFTFGVVGKFDGGLIDFATLNWLPLGANHWNTYLLQIIIGLIFSVIFFFVFKFLIEKFDLPTPGRGVAQGEVELINKKEYKERTGKINGDMKQSQDASSDNDKAVAYLKGLGGAVNIEEITSCTTRLRVTVNNPDEVASDDFFKANNAAGVVRKGKAIQVIVGLDVLNVLGQIEDLLSNSTSNVNVDSDISSRLTDLDNPIDRNAVFMLDALGSSDNIENVEENDSGITVFVKNSDLIDDKEMFINLGLGITDVKVEDHKIEIQLTSKEQYIQSLKKLLN
ncbi:PTS alpha-glucoside transporter subunit IICB [Tetragenococcus halophilus]|uniref:PTS alpha-glucoside transporter subunit IICB n=1 Tax=Tetragenococcus halophilus TaxID=51669 RepID=A0A3G5FHN5_TETHA|nr:alpha-glucoside-specific PTS transporter subunit IIBC [Tetragenococcus halophilus]AYW49791.1 PTS alpha-glucoside transporter subunit IICB [Tetragenococcus halophilus]GBD63109.1 hypothetical protein TEHD23766T_0536 [Tetragenococcus halophilus subsp. flandriensis]